MSLRRFPSLLPIYVLALLPLVPGCGRTASLSAPTARTTPEKASVGLFEDATERAGITFRHTNGDTDRYLFLETLGGGCAFLDYDADGWQDILLLSCGNFGAAPASAPPNLALYRNNGDGTFADVTAGSGLDKPLGYAQGLAVGDYDNDGLPDIFVAGYGGCFLFHNVGVESRESGVESETAEQDRKPKIQNPRFADVTAQAGVSDTDQGTRWASGAAWGDYDNDGRLDLYVCHYAVWSPQIDKKCPRPDGTPGHCEPTVYAGDSDRLYRNEGGGRFRDVSRQTGVDRLRRRGLAVAWLDYDGDGRDDLYVANDMDPNTLLRNRGDGTFEEAGVQAGVAYGADGLALSGMGIGVGDYDRSGRESLFVTNLNGEIFSLFRNEGRGLFTYASDEAGLRTPTLPYSGFGTAFLDFDRDGWLDLVTGNGHVNPYIDKDVPGVHYLEPKGLYRNLGGGRFADLSKEAGAMTRSRATRGLAVGDYDNDGRPDVLCVNRNDRADLFRNVSPDQNHWITLRLVGTESNRDGAGAKVWVTAGGARLYAQCRLGSSYASTSDKRLHFGLGAAETVEKVEVEWPSGRCDRYAGLRANAFYVLTEGKSHAIDRPR